MLWFLGTGGPFVAQMRVRVSGIHDLPTAELQDRAAVSLGVSDSGSSVPDSGFRVDPWPAASNPDP
jgi:hypothetical protein